MESKRYGVLFYPVINKVEKTGTVEIMAKAKDAKQINRIFERMGYPAPVRRTPQKKQAPALRPRTAPRSAGMVPESLPRWHLRKSHPSEQRCRS